MKQTTMQFNGMMANFWQANAAQQLKFGERINETNGCRLSLSSSLNNATTIHAATPAGHEGHNMPMPMPAKPPAAKPASEKAKPKVPPPSPAAKPPAKTADSTDSVARAQ